MKIIRCAILVFGLALSAIWPAAQAGLKQFDTALEMFQELSDFSIDDDSLVILSDDPLVIRLGKPIYKNDPADVVQHELQRSVIYGIYRTFIHTDAEQVAIRSVPILTTFKPHSTEVLDDPVYEVSITREQALEALQEFYPHANLDSLVIEDEVFSKWSDEFNSLYYEDREPGLDAFYEVIEKVSK